MGVEIIGRSCLVPGADCPELLFRLLRNEECTITEVPRDRWDQSRYWHPQIGVPGKTYTFAAGILDDIYAFDPALFGMSRREATFLDPQQRIILNLTWRALEDANLDPAGLAGQKVGVYVGASGLDHANLIVEDPASGGPYFMSGNTLSVVSNRISHVFGLSGPSMTIDTACSSSLIALGQAFNAIVSGAIDMAIVGGVNALSHPLPFIGFAQARMLSPEGLCRAYDDAGEGYVRAEGGAVVILRRSDVARRERDRSHATIVACASNSAGRTNGISLPSPEAQADLLSSIYGEKGIDPARLAFVEGHGTGTRVGDPSELWAIGNAIGSRRQAPIPIGSIKTNIGHTEPASGLLGLMKAMLSLEHNFFPASLHFETPNRNVDLDALNVHVAGKGIKLLLDHRHRFAGVNSFGFGGTNAHVVICDPPRHETEAGTRSTASPFLVSAHSRTALEGLLTGYEEQFARAPAEAPRLIAASGANRAWLDHRFAVADATAASVANSIRSFLQNDRPDGYGFGVAPKRQAGAAFVFSGNGAQWAGMGLDAYRNDAGFRNRFDEIAAVFRSYLDEDMAALLGDENLGSRLSDTRIGQPLLFAVQAALADSLVRRGLRPTVVFGHSVGEIAAAYSAGILSLADAVRIVAIRSLHQHKTAGLGGMAAVAASAEATTALFKAHGLTDLRIAAYNARQSITISGPGDDIRTFAATARRAKIAATILDIDYPFHHPIIDAYGDAFLTDLADLSPQAGHLPFISSVTGEILPGTELNAQYWWRNLREPVLFASAAATALKSDASLLLEIGPRPILKAYLGDAVEVAGRGLALGSLVRRSTDTNENPVGAVFADALTHGAAIDRETVVGKRDAMVRLPSLPFDPETPNTVRTSDAINLYGRKSGASRLVGWRVNPSGTAWKNHVDATLYGDLAEHIVDGKAILPATGFLEIAVSAAQDFFHADQVEIHDFALLHPLELKADFVSELSTLISPETGDIEIRSRERLSEDDWTLHAKGRCRPCETIATLVEPEPDQAGVLESKSSSSAYEVAARLGLCYGPKFRLLEKATIGSDRIIHATLAAPDEPSNPYVGYAVNPMSADAALHGLIAMVDQPQGRATDAPYIPVRIGCATVLCAGATITRAKIEIRSAGVDSIRADITLFDASGRCALVLKDLRLKRTHLHQRASLDMRSFHYEAVASLADDGIGRPSVSREEIRGWVDTLKTGEADSTTLLLGAAAYRVAYDVAETLVDRKREIPASLLLGESEDAAFHSLCLRWLENAGLAHRTEGKWKLTDTCDIPEFSTLLDLIYREDGQRLVEAMALANARLAAMRSASAAGRNITSEATLDHLLVHSVPAQARQAFLEEGVRSLLAPHERSLLVVELGSASASLSRRLADLVRAKAGRYIIVEDREQVRDRLALHFAAQPHVDVVESRNLPPAAQAALVISACHDLHALITENQHVSATLKRLVAGGSAIMAALDAPGIAADIMHGWQSGWLSRTADERVMGRLATAADWESLLQALGSRDAIVRRISRASGDFLILGGTGEIPVPEVGTKDGPSIPAEPIWIEREEPFEIAFDRALAAAIEHRESLVHDLGLASDTEGPVRLQDAMIELAYAAERLNGLSNAKLTGFVPALLVLLDGGMPATVSALFPRTAADPANAGLWTFLRTVRNEYPDVAIHSLNCYGWVRNRQEFSDLTARFVDIADCFEWAIAEDGTLRELRAVPGPFSSTADKTATFEAATVSQTTNSSIAGIGWTTCERASPSANQVAIEVVATGLNFRDVMWAMGLLPSEALEDGFAGMTIGMECAGTVVAVGADVTRFSVGDRVMAFAPAAFSTHVNVDARAVMALPEGISEIAGATVPVAFLTAYYALIELGRLKDSETVLVHGGAGGVGLAALQIAKLAGARVIATAGSKEKRALLRTLGADHVFDSRSLAFVTAIEKLTGGAGVDIVLNSLAGDAMERSIGLLRPFGRFLELGKRDYYADRKIGLRPFRRNVSYFGIDADQLLLADPALTESLFDKLANLFASRELHPLPHRVFNHDEIATAFRLMQGSGHIGKIVIKPPRAGRDAVRHGEGPARAMDRDAVHLVVGGIGGFGLAAADWLVEKGARKIALCSRRGIADEATLERIASWHARGVKVSVLSCDITDRARTEAMLVELRSQAPIRSVIHAAMVLDDGLLSNLSRGRTKPVVETKALGAEHLDALTRDDDLDHFILFSSVTTLIGNIGQANYVAANGYLEGLARRRRMQGLPALAVAFGPISDAGILASRAALGDRLARRLGEAAMPASEALSHVEAYIDRDTGTVEESCVTIANLDWSAVSKLRLAKTNLFDPVRRARRNTVAALDATSQDLSTLLADKPEAEAEAIVFGIVAEELATALQIPSSSVSRAMVLKDIGLDSLMAVELGISLERRTGLEVTLSGLSETTTIGELSAKLLAKARRAETVEEAEVPDSDFRHLASRHSATG